MKQKIFNFIKKIQANDMAANYIWVFLGQNIGSVFSMISLMITLKIISLEDYGSLVVIQTYCVLISDIFCMRTFNGVIKFTTEAEQKNDSILIHRFLNTGLFLDAAAGLCAFGFGFLLLQPITSLMGWAPETVRHVNMYLPVVLFLPVLNGTPVGILRKLGFFKHVNIIHAAVYGLQMLALLLIMMHGSSCLQTVLVVYVLTEILESIVLLAFACITLQKNQKYRNFWRSGLVKSLEFVKYNISYGLLSTFDQVLGNVSTLLINKYVGNFTTASLKVITKICSVLTKVTNPISQIFYPELCRWVTDCRYKEALRIIRKYFASIMALGGVLSVILFTTYDYWIVIFDAAMIEARGQSILYFAYTIMSVSLICLHQLSFALDMMRFNLILVGVMDMLYLALLIPAIQLWGVYGYLTLLILQLALVGGMKYFYIKRKIYRCADWSGQAI